MIIRAKNLFDTYSPNTYLSFTELSGTSTIRVRNVNLFSSSWGVQLGNTGEAQAEIVVTGTAAITGTSLTLNGTTQFDHPTDTPVYAVKYDQIVFERSTTGTTAAASPIANGTLKITPNALYTQFDDTSGSPSYGYRTYFRNSITGNITSESDWITSTGFSFYSLGAMRKRVKDKLVNSTYIVDDRIINDWINEWQEVMVNTAIDVNEDYLIGTLQIAFPGTVDVGTITQTDFKQMRRVWYIDGAGTFQATKMDSNSFSPNKSFTDTYPYFFMQGDTVIGRRPYDIDGTFLCEYYKLSPVLVEDTDTLPVSMWAYSKTFIDYAHAQALFKDQKIEEAGAKNQQAYEGLGQFKKEISPRSKTGPTYIDIVEDTAADQELWL